MLISRVAGLGTLRHRPIGFTGPLSQHLLGYNSIVNVVRQTIRDMVEVACTQMFLTGCCNRHANLSDISVKYEKCECLAGRANQRQVALPAAQQLRPQHCRQVVS
jgi:hypothetical protein